MPNTYTLIYVQTLFAVKYRNAVIAKKLQPDTLATVDDLINETGCKTIIVNGVEDQVNCFFY